MNDISGYIVAVTGTASLIWGGIIEPNRRRAKMKHDEAESARIEAERVRDELAERTRILLDGVKGEPGFYDDVMGIAERTRAVEVGLSDVKTEVAENTAAVNTMSLRQAQANGTMKRIEGMVRELTGLPEDAITLPEVKNAIDMTDEHSQSRQSAILEAITHAKDSHSQ